MAIAANGVTTEYTLNGTTAIQVMSLTANASLHSLQVFNKSSSTMYIGWGTGGIGVAPAGSGGIPIPAGGNLIYGAYDAARLPQGDLWADSIAGNIGTFSFTANWT